MVPIVCKDKVVCSSSSYLFHDNLWPLHHPLHFFPWWFCTVTKQPACGCLIIQGKFSFASSIYKKNSILNPGLLNNCISKKEWKQIGRHKSIPCHCFDKNLASQHKQIFLHNYKVSTGQMHSTMCLKLMLHHEPYNYISCSHYKCYSMKTSDTASWIVPHKLKTNKQVAVWKKTIRLMWDSKLWPTPYQTEQRNQS